MNTFLRSGITTLSNLKAVLRRYNPKFKKPNWECDALKILFNRVWYTFKKDA